jgi:ubiquinol-cytochrome c reductase cytochrome b subunit
VHEPLDEYKRYRLVSYHDRQVQPPQPNHKGKITGPEKMRARISRVFFEDRVAPVTPAELEAAHHHHEVEAATAGPHDRELVR